MKLVLIILIIFGSSGSYADIRDSARELLLSGERGKSYELLINSLANKKNNIKIKKELDNLSNIFVSEKSQKYFQQAKTLFYSGDKSYKSKLEAAENLEPENLKIIFTKAWFLLIEKKCVKARVELDKLKKLNIHYDGLAAIDFYVNLCDDKTNAECGGFNYNINDSLMKKVVKLASCRRLKESLTKRQTYCKLLKIDLEKLPELDLWCSTEPKRLAVYKSRCSLMQDKADRRKFLEVYPFMCIEKISSKVIDD